MTARVWDADVTIRIGDVVLPASSGFVSLSYEDAAARYPASDRYDPQDMGIRFDGHPWCIRVWFSRPSPYQFPRGTWLVEMEAHVSDRDTGMPTKVHLRRCVNFCDKPSKGLLAEYARGMAHDLARHEIDEFLKLDGERIFDPHAKAPR